MYISCSRCNKVDDDDYFLAKLFDRHTMKESLYYHHIVYELYALFPFPPNGDMELM